MIRDNFPDLIDGPLSPKLEVINNTHSQVNNENDHPEVRNKSEKEAIVFLDNYGDIIKLDGEILGFDVQMSEMMLREDNPLRELSTFSGYEISWLLLDPISILFEDRNGYPSEEVIESLNTNLLTLDQMGTWRTNMDTYLYLVDEWKYQQLNLRAQFFKNDGFQTETLRKTWIKYLTHRGYDLGIINFIANPYRSAPGNNLLLSFRDTKNIDHILGRTAIAILKHEYRLLHRRFTDWVTELLKNEELDIFANSNLDIDTIYNCMKFKNNGKIKAWYDDSDGEGYWNPGYDHETWPDKYNPKRHEVSLSFRHYADLIFVDDSSDWIWYSEPWLSSGYIGTWEEISGALLGDAMMNPGGKLWNWLTDFPLS